MLFRSVQPDANITRAEAATIFFRMLTDDSRARYWSESNDYTDVSEQDWYNVAISTLRNADRLLVLDHGEVAECGTHVELLEKQGIYYKLVMAQARAALEKTGGMM